MNVEFGDLMGMSMVGSIMSRLQIKEDDRIKVKKLPFWYRKQFLMVV